MPQQLKSWPPTSKAQQTTIDPLLCSHGISSSYPSGMFLSCRLMENRTATARHHSRHAAAESFIPEIPPRRHHSNVSFGFATEKHRIRLRSKQLRHMNTSSDLQACQNLLDSVLFPLSALVDETTNSRPPQHYLRTHEQSFEPPSLPPNRLRERKPSG